MLWQRGLGLSHSPAPKRVASSSSGRTGLKRALLCPGIAIPSRCHYLRARAEPHNQQHAVSPGRDPRGAPRAPRPLRSSIHVQSARAAAHGRRRRAPSERSAEDSQPTKPPQKKKSAVERATEDDIDDLVPLTPAQKVGVGLNLSAWAAGLGLKQSVCGYYIFRSSCPRSYHQTASSTKLLKLSEATPPSNACTGRRSRVTAATTAATARAAGTSSRTRLRG